MVSYGSNCKLRSILTEPNTTNGVLLISFQKVKYFLLIIWWLWS